jgi:hypothetical protein
VGGSLLLLCLAVFVADTLLTLFAGQRAVGVVTSFATSRGSSYPVVEFRTNSGETVTFTAPFSFRRYQRGEPVDVAYRSGDARKAMILRPIWQEVFWVPTLLILWAAVRSIRVGWRQRKAKL